MTRERGPSTRGLLGGAAAALALLCALAAGSAEAQAPAANGIKIGEGRLHPFIEIDGRYDSLVGLFPISAGSTTVAAGGDIVLHARPGLKFELNNASTAINFTGSGEYLFYTGLLSTQTRSFSRFQANVAADARFNQDGAVEVQLTDSLSRSERTQNPAIAIGVLSLYNQVGLAVPIHPGGKALTITPRVNWGVEFFDPLGSATALPGCVPGTPCDPSPANLAKMNYSNLGFGLNGNWKFLPKTALTVDVGTDVRTYWTGQSPAATIFRAQAGLLGLVSSHISVTLLAGYAGDFATMKLHTVIGNLEGSYAPSQLIKVTLGYLRTVQAVPTLSTYIDDRAYLRAVVGLWAGRLTLGAQASFDYLSFTQVTPTQRFDLVFSGGVNATVAITSWFDTGLSYNLSLRDSNSLDAAVNPPPRHEVMLRLAFHY